MTKWPSMKPSQLLNALKRAGWTIDRQKGSHVVLYHPKREEVFVFAYHPSKELHPKLVAKIAKQTGLRPEDL